MLRSGTTTIADPENPTEEITVNLIDASQRQSSQVEYLRIEEMNSQYDIKYSSVFSGTGTGLTVHMDISDDLDAGWRPLLAAHTHTIQPGAIDYMSNMDKSFADSWGVPNVAWSPGRNDFTVYIPDGRGLGTGACYGPGCIPR
jgi:hypothetical protein